VIAVSLAQLDLAHALAPGAILLCEAGPAESVAALALVRARASGGLRDLGADHAARLAVLGEEIARLAAALAAVPPSPAGHQALADRTRGYTPPPGEEPLVTAAELRAAIRARRLRDGLFGPGWFGDPVWDMLLDLFAAELEGRDVSISSLCIAAAVAPTTALRHASRMEEAGLIERRPDPADRRRAFLRLVPGTRAALARHVAELKRLGLPLA
jgi:DNA-binding transcriptional ArsR family regulator